MEGGAGQWTSGGTSTLEPAPNWTDCRTFPSELLRDRVALFIASYPCQGESHAGKRLGAKDPRWLWPAVKRGVEEMRPLRCFFENVEGHISKGLRTVCRDLEALGYRVACGIFSAEEVGANHRRNRIFIMADALWIHGSSWQHALRGRRRVCEIREELADAERSSGRSKQRAQSRQRKNQGPQFEPVLGRAGEELAAATRLRGREEWPEQPGRDGLSASELDGDSMADAERVAKSGDDEAIHGGRLSNGAGSENGGRHLADAERSGFGEQRRTVAIRPEFTPVERCLPHFPPRPAALNEWARILEIDPSLEPALCRMADGMAHRVDRLRLTGNGVVPDTAALAYVTLDQELSI